MQVWCAGGQLWISRIRRSLLEDSAATAVEYAIMLAFITAVIVAAVAVLGRSTAGEFSKVVFP